MWKTASGFLGSGPLPGLCRRRCHLSLEIVSSTSGKRPWLKKEPVWFVPPVLLRWIHGAAFAASASVWPSGSLFFSSLPLWSGPTMPTWFTFAYSRSPPSGSASFSSVSSTSFSSSSSGPTGKLFSRHRGQFQRGEWTHLIEWLASRVALILYFLFQVPPQRGRDGKDRRLG